jgi:hypothetical protein
LQRREVVRGRPEFGQVFLAEIVGAALEGFERGRVIGKIFELQILEVLAPDIDVQVLAPVIV